MSCFQNILSGGLLIENYLWYCITKVGFKLKS